MFSWHAKSITSVEILIQVVLRDPLYISTNPLVLDELIITIRPAALVYMRSIATDMMTEDPLRTVIRDFPPQIITGATIEAVEQVSVIMKDAGKSLTVTNVVVQIFLSGSMTKMWSMVNAEQILLTYMRLNSPMPGNVILVMTNLESICDFNFFPTDEIMSSTFNFTQTDSPGVGFF